MKESTTRKNSLGFEKAPGETRVVVAMSGGVDSSVVAAQLAGEGYDVVGVTLQLYDHGAALAKKGACCAGRDIHDARKVAGEMGFPHYVLDYESRFREAVIDDFVDRYLAGATPIPCVRCNQTVKFRDLLATARDLEADCLATGHYVRRCEGPLKAELHRAEDHSRDQSYFLFATTQEQIDFLRFPLGHVPNKAETRALATKFGLSVADKPDSQDICFVPSGNYAQVIEKLRPGAAEPGDIVHLDGRVMGEHRGIVHYTVGQRRGIGIGGSAGGGEPLYVVRIDAETRRVTVGPRSALATSIVPVGEINWIGDAALADAPDGGHEVLVRIRSTRPPVPARLHPKAETAKNRANGGTKNGVKDRAGGGCAEVELLTPEEGVAPGQACVFYAPEGSRVLGGGWIAKS